MVGGLFTDKSILTAAATDQNRLSTTISLLVAGVISLFVILGVQSVHKTYYWLTRAAEKIAEGDLSFQAQVTTQDEIGTLAPFNTMVTTQLRDLFETLESRVLRCCG